MPALPRHGALFQPVPLEDSRVGRLVVRVIALMALEVLENLRRGSGFAVLGEFAFRDGQFATPVADFAVSDE